MGFFWVNFWSREFLVLLEALGIFLGLDFLLPSDHPPLEIPSTSLGII